MGQSFTVRIEGADSEAGIIGRGTTQGCPLSPLLFNIYIHELLNETLGNVTGGVATGGRLVQAIRFADDQAMTASSEEGLQRMMETLERTSEEYVRHAYKPKEDQSNDVYQRSTEEGVNLATKH